MHWGSGTDMMTGPSPVTNASIYNGETYDARLEADGWNSNGFVPPTSWSHALNANGPGGVLSSHMHPPIRALEVIKPIGITSPQPGLFVVQFPRNFAGVCRLRVKGQAGNKVTLRHAEILKNDGSGMIYTDNLRSALATDVYTLKGSSDGELFSPRFTYHGFAYVEVTGFPGTLTLEIFTKNQLLKSGAVLEERSFLLKSLPSDCTVEDVKNAVVKDIIAGIATTFQLDPTKVLTDENNFPVNFDRIELLFQYFNPVISSWRAIASEIDWLHAKQLCMSHHEKQTVSSVRSHTDTLLSLGLALLYRTKLLTPYHLI